MGARAIRAAATSALLLWAGSAVALRPRPLVEVQPGTARPGDVVLITVRGEKAPAGGSVGDKSLLFVRTGRGFCALFGVPVEQPPGELSLKIQLPGSPAAKDSGEIALTVEIIEPGFPSRELQVSNQYINPSPKAKRWMAQDQAAFRRAYEQPLTGLLFRRSFAWPRDPLVTSHFGDLRLYNGQKQSQHFGTDLNGRIGDPVAAANDGVVVLARACYASGNTVIIHHGGGLFTAYFHLSRMQVNPGKKVVRGERIGLVGKTGRVTGPHLHWASKVNSLYVNAESLLQLKFD
jgi:murein DD-endopeptidase MepM/ murein hydrolase activator NlpD